MYPRDLLSTTGDAGNRVRAPNVGPLRFACGDEDAFRIVQQDIHGVCATPWGREPPGEPGQRKEDTG